MTELQQLYQELIVKYSQSPENFREIPGCTHSASMSNPLCGDDISVQACLEDGSVVDAAFQGVACAICMASASLMTREISGLKQSDVQELKSRFFSIFEEPNTAEALIWLDDNFPDLLAFKGVAKYPVRVQCARLPWEAVSRALDGAVVT